MIFAMGVLPMVLLVLGFPIFIVLLSGATLALVVHMNVPLTAIQQNLFGSLNSPGLLAVPYFIFAGELMSRGTVSQRLVDFVGSMVGRVPGSLGVTTVGTATMFGAISGSSAASVASVGKVMQPAMTRDGYPAAFSAGMITSVSAIGIVIPPSIPMIVYGASAEASIPRLYAAGVVPGLILAAALAIYIMIRARAGGFGSGASLSFRRFAQAGLRAAWALGAPVIVLGGIYGGVFSPTEAAAVACAYALVVTRFVYRELGWRDILDAAIGTVFFTAQVLIIIAVAGLFSWILTVNQVPQALVSWIAAQEMTAWQFLLLVNIVLLVVGCFMDPLSAILLLTPLLIPIVEAFGIDKVHFGIVMTLNLAIGLFTPPFGINIFVAQSVLKMRTPDIYRGVLPFFWIFVAVLLLITYLPSITLWGMELFLF
ncbi:TRAP transporter large permease [Paracoccus siganidrum]|uniref:TRAP transporter large permease protein n=1 Tax=Paracoccus siganidrum TaxID=1276757 RepID=A0A419A6H0_9RHOB|nr:TRAP transporter large permease [Paracoccus siganidrum]RJL14820.1 TRAP transporter large permease [Paracoccus siganidrum]RMC29998.1 TRAP transporter large permease [Paracoccus siganidrum]